MKTAKAAPSDPSLGRRAQPLRQTRNNPPRSSVSSARNFGSRSSLGGGMDEAPIDIFPAITHFADAITALPKEIVRHFTLLKEVDAKIFAPEDDLTKLVEAALNAPLPPRPQLSETQHSFGPTSAPMSAQNSLNGSIINGHAGSIMSAPEADPVYDPANIPRRQLFKHCAYTMQNMLVSLDEKNHVISTAGEALNKQLARIEDCFPYIELEISEEARYGSTTHWAYPENRLPKTSGVSRRELASANQLSAAAQHMAEEAAARSDARKQALLERKKGKNQPVESDFDDNHDNKNKKKELQGNSKVRKAAEPSLSVGLGIANGNTANGNPPKRRKVEKGPAGGAVMERSLSAVFNTNGATAKGKPASPRATPQPEPAKKRSRAPAATNGQTRKRNNTITSAMSPSLASSPTRTTFPDPKVPGKFSPPPTNGRPASIRARQNSTQSNIEKRPASASSNKPNGTSTPDPVTVAVVTGRNLPEAKATTKENGTNLKAEHPMEGIEQDGPENGGAVGGTRKDVEAKQEEPETNGNAMPAIQPIQVVTTKSGRASKPSTPALTSSFPEPVRSRSSRGHLEGTSNNKRSHKKGAGAAAQLLASRSVDTDDMLNKDADDEDEDGEIDADEPRYCYCNNVSYGEMVGCDADGCEREWFHLECVGLKTAPKGNAKWYCEDCKEKLKTKRLNGR